MSEKKWKDDFYVTCYLLAGEGLPDYDIAKAIGVFRTCLVGWKKKRPALRRAIDKGRKEFQKRSHNDGVANYIYKMLSPEAKEVWKELNRVVKNSSYVDRVEALFEKNGTLMRQHLFIHALVLNSYNMSKAMRKLAISKKTLDKWKFDKQFSDLLDEINFHKGQLFESKLVDAVVEGDTSLVRFANERFNREIYGNKIDINHSGNINNTTTQLNVPIMELELDLDTKKKVLQALEKWEAKQNDSSDSQQD